jgi:hypothetical protein
MVFDVMGTDEKLDHCNRIEEMPESAWDPVWTEVNAHLGRSAYARTTCPNW